MRLGRPATLTAMAVRTRATWSWPCPMAATSWARRRRASGARAGDRGAGLVGVRTADRPLSREPSVSEADDRSAAVGRCAKRRRLGRRTDPLTGTSVADANPAVQGGVPKFFSVRRPDRESHPAGERTELPGRPPVAAGGFLADAGVRGRSIAAESACLGGGRPRRGGGRWSKPSYNCPRRSDRQSISVRTFFDGSFEPDGQRDQRFDDQGWLGMVRPMTPHAAYRGVLAELRFFCGTVRPNGFPLRPRLSRDL